MPLGDFDFDRFLQEDDYDDNWSTNEEIQFSGLVEEFGTDWEKIAQHFKTKTWVMVKQHFRDCTKDGNDQVLVRFAANADERRKRNEQLLLGEPSQTGTPADSESLFQSRSHYRFTHGDPYPTSMPPGISSTPVPGGGPIDQGSNSLLATSPKAGQSGPKSEGPMSIAHDPGGNLTQKTPCDACRRRRSRCVIHPGAALCVLCEYHKQECTFKMRPKKEPAQKQQEAQSIYQRPERADQTKDINQEQHDNRVPFWEKLLAHYCKQEATTGEHFQGWQKALSFEQRTTVAVQLHSSYRLLHPEVSEANMIGNAIRMEEQSFRDSLTYINYDDSVRFQLENMETERRKGAKSTSSSTVSQSSPDAEGQAQRLNYSTDKEASLTSAVPPVDHFLAGIHLTQQDCMRMCRYSEEHPSVGHAEIGGECA